VNVGASSPISRTGNALRRNGKCSVQRSVAGGRFAAGYLHPLSKTCGCATISRMHRTRANSWQLRSRTLEFPRRPLLMGIINVTPDSFSDGGRFLNPAAAIEHANRLVTDGADLLDIGGESTRPHSQPVSKQEELDRVLTIVEAVCKQVPVPVSIDTSKAEVAQAAIELGAEIINDVTALQGDPQMLEVVRRSGAGVCIMHMQGTPATMQEHPQYDNVVVEVFEFLQKWRDDLVAAGVEPNRICVDPGIGFGKTPQHNLDLLSNCRRFHELRCPVLIGHSRKSFLRHFQSDLSFDPTAATIGLSCGLALQGVQILRVHDVSAVRQALLAFEMSGNDPV
jgi:dihydropteroate synthase